MPLRNWTLGPDPTLIENNESFHCVQKELAWTKAKVQFIAPKGWYINGKFSHSLS